MPKVSRACRVLLIEDDQPLAETIRSGLEEEGLTVEWQLSGWMGLASATSRPPDAIILDLGLPDAEGTEILRQLREDPRTQRVPVVVCSGNPRLLGPDAAILVRAIVPKPFDLDHLLDSVLAVTRR